MRQLQHHRPPLSKGGGGRGGKRNPPIFTINVVEMLDNPWVVAPFEAVTRSNFRIKACHSTKSPVTLGTLLSHPVQFCRLLQLCHLAMPASLNPGSVGGRRRRSKQATTFSSARGATKSEEKRRMDVQHATSHRMTL